MDCGSYDLEVYIQQNCTGGYLTYPNAITVNNTLNPNLYNVIPYPVPSAGQLRLRLSGSDIDFIQGSTTLAIRLVHPTTGRVLTGSNINPTNFNNSIATVDFTPSPNDCGNYNLEISNVPTGCGTTTTVVYNRFVYINGTRCGNNVLIQPVLAAEPDNYPIIARVNDGIGSVDDLNKPNDADLGLGELSVQVFPNPMDQQTNILIEGEGQQTLNFTLYDVLGQLVKQTSIETNERLQLNRENLSAGMYIYRILDATGNPLHVGKLEMK